MSDQLHVYRCSFCKTIATAKYRATFYRCGACRRLLAFQWSQPIETEADRALAGRGLVFNPWGEKPTTPPVKRHRCANQLCLDPSHPEAEMLHDPGIGWFCSEPCQVAGREQYEAFLARVRKLREEQPDLYFADNAKS